MNEKQLEALNNSLSAEHQQKQKRIEELKSLLAEETDILNCFSYIEIVRPLVLLDRTKGFSYRRLAIKYQLTLKRIQYIIETFNL